MEADSEFFLGKKSMDLVLYSWLIQQGTEAQKSRFLKALYFQSFIPSNPKALKEPHFPKLRKFPKIGTRSMWSLESHHKSNI